MELVVQRNRARSFHVQSSALGTSEFPGENIDSFLTNKTINFLIAFNELLTMNKLYFLAPSEGPKSWTPRVAEYSITV